MLGQAQWPLRSIRLLQAQKDRSLFLPLNALLLLLFLVKFTHFCGNVIMWQWTLNYTLDVSIQKQNISSCQVLCISTVQYHSNLVHALFSSSVLWSSNIALDMTSGRTGIFGWQFQLRNIFLLYKVANLGNINDRIYWINTKDKNSNWTKKTNLGFDWTMYSLGAWLNQLH